MTRFWKKTRREGKSPQSGMNYDKTDKQEKSSVGGKKPGQFQQPNQKKQKWYPSNQEINHIQSRSNCQQGILQRLNNLAKKEIREYQLSVFQQIDVFEQQQQERMLQEEARINQEQASYATNYTNQSSIISIEHSHLSSESSSSNE